MTKRNLTAVLLLFVLVFLAACDPTPDLPGSPVPTPTAVAETLPPIPTPEPTPTPAPTPTPDPVAEELAALTTEQKIGQLLVAGLTGTEPGEDGLAAIETYQVGGIILFRRNIEEAGQLLELLNGLKELNGSHVPLFLCVDQEGGRVDRMPPQVRRTPSARAVGEAGAGGAYGALLAQECAAFGFNLDFAPCLDIWSNPENTVIGDRALGTGWEQVAQEGLAALAALDPASGVIPVVKHFPGHGDTGVDSHAALPVVDKSLEELRQRELLPFQEAIQSEAAPAVMVGHILLEQVDPAYPASLSPVVITGLLREELGFDGVVCTDDLTMGAISNTYGMGEAAVLAVEAGCDLLLVCHGADRLAEARLALLEAVDGGRISQARLDESVYRILALKRAYRLNSRPSDPPDLQALNARIDGLLP